MRGARRRVEGVYPNELAPLADELEPSVSANRDVVERARTQVGNLAHALKTPLSVLINEAGDATIRSPARCASRRRSCATRSPGISTAPAAARASAIGATTEVAPGARRALLRTFRKIHRERLIEMRNAPPDLRFLGERQGFRRPRRQSPRQRLQMGAPDGRARWRWSRLPADARRSEIVIDDDGPGLAPDARGVRAAAGSTKQTGLGPGLSIVAELSAAYGGALALQESPSGGLRRARTSGV